MTTSIRSVVAKIIHDNNLDPAEYRVIFKRQSDEYWDVPFNYLRFKENYFQYLDSDTLYPLHRIVAVYSITSGKYLIKRQYDPSSVIVMPQSIEILVGTPIEHQYDTFTVARFAWLILRAIEHVLRNTEIDKEEVLNTLGSYEEFEKGTYVVRDGYFSGTLIVGNTILRGMKPLDYDAIRARLSFQRLYLFEMGEIKFMHVYSKRVYVVTPSCEVEIYRSCEINYYGSLLETYSLILINNKIAAAINRETNLTLSPLLTYRILGETFQSRFADFITSRAHWVYHKNKYAFIMDYDAILSGII